MIANEIKRNAAAKEVISMRNRFQARPCEITSRRYSASKKTRKMFLQL